MTASHWPRRRLMCGIAAILLVLFFLPSPAAWSSDREERLAALYRLLKLRQLGLIRTASGARPWLSKADWTQYLYVQGQASYGILTGHIDLLLPETRVRSARTVVRATFIGVMAGALVGAVVSAGLHWSTDQAVAWTRNLLWLAGIGGVLGTILGLLRPAVEIKPGPVTVPPPQ